MWQERSVGGDDDDDRSDVGWDGSCHSGPRTAARGAARHHVRNLLTDRRGGGAEVAAASVIALHQDTHGVPAIRCLEPPGGCPDPSLELIADHPRAAPDAALGDG